MKSKNDMYDDTEIHKVMNDFTKELDRIIEDTVTEILNQNSNSD